MNDLLYGKSPILEALRAGRRKIHRFFYSNSPSDPSLVETLQLCQKKGIKTKQVTKNWIEEKIPGALTQGFLAEVGDYPYLDAGELLLSVQEKPKSLILALDQIQDPQNLGAIMRSAECCGVDGVLIPEDRSTHVTSTVCKAAAGAVEYLNVSLVTNLARCLRDFKEVGFWVVGSTLESDSSIKVEDALDFKWPEKVVLILGSEGKGMRRLTQESCDFLLHLPLTGKITSLNVAAAAAVFLYEIIRSRRNSRK